VDTTAEGLAPSSESTGSPDWYASCFPSVSTRAQTVAAAALISTVRARRRRLCTTYRLPSSPNEGRRLRQARRRQVDILSARM